MKRRHESVRTAAARIQTLLQGEGWAAHLRVEARDGTGGKSRVPWIRIFDPKTSPSSTNGWYVVILFSASGDGAYLSLNQGTSKWVKKAVVRAPLEAIQERTSYARTLLDARGMRLAGGVGTFSLGDRDGSLGRGYEVGNVLAYDLTSSEFANDVEIIEQIRQLEAARLVLDDKATGFRPGVPYRPARAGEVADTGPFSRDPAKLERALASHAETQNALAEILRGNGLEPRSPVEEPDYDLAWIQNEWMGLAEVKSMPKGGEVAQLRAGIGQLLHYRELLNARQPSLEVRLVLATSEKPGALAMWNALCARVGITLTCGPSFQEFRALVAGGAHVHVSGRDARTPAARRSLRR
jgi:hypothetical protein